MTDSPPPSKPAKNYNLSLSVNWFPRLASKSIDIRVYSGAEWTDSPNRLTEVRGDSRYTAGRSTDEFLKNESVFLI